MIIVLKSGKVVTRYEFNQLFSKAWFRAMTAENIVSTFSATGVCPFDRSALDVEEVKDDGLFKPKKTHPTNRTSIYSTLQPFT